MSGAAHGPADTIAAVSTAAGPGLRAVVRLSGPDAVGAAARVFRPEDQRAPDLEGLPGFRVIRGSVRFSGRDPAIPVEVLLMRAPRSYTRQDVVEFHLPGAVPLAERVLAGFLESGIRLAAPGEFTRRAFLSGRIDLTQVEAVLEIIRAASRRELEGAVRRCEGAFGRGVAAVRRGVLRLAARIEADLDFSDQDVEPFAPARIREELRGLRTLLGDLRRARPPDTTRQGLPTVLLLGPPNAGKSSLLNALVGTRRALVSEVPGTTLDAVDVTLEIEGLPLRVVDAPGIGPLPGGALEREAARRAQGWERAADLVVLVVDASRPAPEGLDVLLRRIEGVSGVLAAHQSDRGRVLEDSLLGELAGARRIVSTSARTGEGLGELRREMARIVLEGPPGSGDAPAANARQARLLAGASSALDHAARCAQQGLPLELLALEVREAADHLGEVTGERFTEDLLERIFAEFCIGK